MPPKRKVTSREFVDDSDDADDTRSTTKKRKRQEHAAASSEEEMIPLSAKRFISVSEFRGKLLVSIREYYTDDSGEQKPGRKGISLSLDQWEKLKEAIPAIDAKIKDE